ncbi:MAG: glycerate kinase [Paludibacteraceae bacterium]|nr:glycerate kinase [Paludibacteraceae bacterium]
MKIVLVIDSLKGCLSSASAEEAARRGAVQACPDAEVVCIPASDGGEGMLEAFTAATGGLLRQADIHDPLMRPIRAAYGMSADKRTAVIESAQASGLMLLRQEDLNPLKATSFGTGELIADALRQGCQRLIVGLGGSATSDAGKGMLQALGADISDKEIDTSRFLLRQYPAEVIVASDVQNPLYGPAGAAHVFAPQKGASPAMVARLDEAARAFAALTAAHTGHDYACCPGAGAAGGMGFALMAYMQAEIRPGADLLLDMAGFDATLQGADLVITGEGSADRQTLMGKLPLRVMQRAAKHHVPTALIAGRIEDRELLLAAGFSSAESINPPELTQEEAMQEETARQNITATVSRLTSLLTACRN